MQTTQIAYCVNCGTRALEDTRFCVKCGASLTSRVEEQIVEVRPELASAQEPSEQPNTAEMIFNSLPGGPTVARFLTESQRMQLDAMYHDTARLIETLDSPEVAMRANAALALAGTREPQALESLSRTLDDPSECTRAAALLALGQSGHSAAIPRMRELLQNDRSDLVACAAVGALGLLGDHAAVNELIALLEDSPDDVAETALTVVASFGRFGPGGVKQTVASGEPETNIEGNIAKAIEASGVDAKLAGLSASRLYIAAKKRIRTQEIMTSVEQAQKGLKSGFIWLGVGFAITVVTFMYGYMTTDPGGTFTYFLFWGPMAWGAIVIVFNTLRLLIHWREWWDSVN